MINKRCGVCARYFNGQLDGEYTCPDCDRMGYAKPLPPVSVLDRAVVAPRPHRAVEAA